MSKNLPSLHIRGSNQQSSEASQLWLRLSAFLSLKSANTQRNYAGIVSEWCSFLGAEAGTADAASLMIGATDMKALAYRKWLESQPGQKSRLTSSKKSTSSDLQVNVASTTNRDGTQSTLSNATIRKKLAALRRIYRMLLSADLGIKSNPFDTDKIPPPSAQSGQKRPTEMVDYKVVSEILSQPDTNTLKGLRDKTILAVLFGGGLRRSEALNLRLGDVNLSQQGTTYLRLRNTKSKKDADQALPTWAAKCVKDLISERKKDGAESGDYLFVSFRGPGGNTPTNKPLSDSGLYKLFKKYCKLAGAGDFATPHSARATAITKLLEDGIPHREVQEFSRHASVQMVEVYDKRRLSVDESPAKGLDFDS